MPLLNKEPFVRKKLNPKLPDDAEVFFCNATNEAFTDYDEFFERSILCSSMVWSCSVTGRSGLTFQEAATSELEAITMISSFSPGLQRALLYLIKTVGSSKFNDIAYSVWAFATQRYFVEEEVEVVSNNGLIDARIVRVIPPNLEALTEEQSINIAYGIDPNLYRYEIVPTKKGKLNFRMIVPAEKVSRSPFLTKEKVKLFLKQHVTCKKRMKITELKDSSVRRFNLNGICWNDIFSGPLPDYDSSHVTMPKRKPLPPSRSDSRIPSRSDPRSDSRSDRRKQTLPGISTKDPVQRGKPGPKPMSPEAKKLKMEEQKRQRAEAKRLERAKLREEKEKREQLMNEWKKKRDDLECDDLEPLPLPVCPISGHEKDGIHPDLGYGLVPVVSKIPDHCFGDALMVLEYFNNFEEFFDLKEIFPHGFTFDLLERALVNKTIDSPIGDLVRITLQTIFCLQEDEDKNDSSTAAASSQSADQLAVVPKDADSNEEEINNNGKEKDDENDDNGDAKEDELSLAMAKAKGALIHLKSLHGQPLSGLTANAYSITELLRQHLLISGSPKPRSIYRGWFSSREDAGLALKLSHPELMISLEKLSIFDLDTSDRLVILKTLMEQVSSFPAFRELVDVASEKLCEVRKEMRNVQAEYSRWERENMIKRTYGKKCESEEGGKNGKKPESEEGGKNGKKCENEEGGKEDSVRVEEEESLKLEREKRVQELNKTLELLRSRMRRQDAQHSVRPLGRDRAYRRYWTFNSIHGLFIETGEEHIGVCIEDGTPQFPQHSRHSQYSQGIVNGHSPTMSDKENDYKERKDQSLPSDPHKNRSKLDYCTGSPDTCTIHGSDRVTNTGTWAFMIDGKGLKDLILSSNPRGIRESDLKDSLEKDFDTIEASINKCPYSKLNQNIPEEEVRKSNRQTTYKPGSKLSYTDREPEEALMRTFADQLITLEEQLFSSGFSFRNPHMLLSRDDWRKLITDTISTLEGKGCSDTTSTLEGKGCSDTTSTLEGKGCSDTTSTLEGKGCSDTTSTREGKVEVLAKCLSNLTQSILPNNLTLPLGSESGSLSRFLESLDELSGSSQLFLFLDTLDSSISWSKSALTAYCRICRKKKGADQMLLCDGCNRGYHTYCLSPPLDSVPVGEWFCSECKPKPKIPLTPRKVRTDPVNYNEIDSDVDMDPHTVSHLKDKGAKKLSSDTKDDDSDFSVTDDDDDEDNDDDDDDDESQPGSASSSLVGEPAPCTICNEPETDLECTTCTKRFHLKCHGSSNVRASRNSWTCSACASRPPKIKLVNESVEGSGKIKLVNESVNESVGVSGKRKRNAPKQADGFMYDEKAIATAVSKGIVPKDGQPLAKKVALSTLNDQFDRKHAQLLLQKLSKHDSSWPFFKTPRARDAPDYETKIKNHQDLTLIGSKAKDGAYDKMSSFVTDLKRMFTNCEVYWPSVSPQYQAGKELSKYFNQLLLDANIGANGPSSVSEKKMNGLNGQSTIRETRSRNR